MNTLTYGILAATLLAFSPARADLTYVCDETVTEATTPESAEIALVVTNEKSAHPSWSLLRKGKKFKGQKSMRSLSSGYQVKVKGKDVAEKAAMLYVFDGGRGECNGVVKASVEVSIVADGRSQVLETRPCTCSTR